jgi:hypothetical protein
MQRLLVAAARGFAVCSAMQRLLVAAALAATPPAKEVASFGIITDVHYADADTSGTRYYRDSLPKVRASIADLASRSTDFLIELGDFKDTDVGSGCGKGKATPACINLTLSFLATIEAEMATFPGPRFHLLGNHDVDVLNQSAVLNATTNSPVTDPGGPGYYSFDFPFAPEPVGNDTDGCLVRDGVDVWIVHADGTRNWLSMPPAGASDAARPIADASAYPKRHGGKGAYNLDADQSAAAFAQRCHGCVCDGVGLPAALPSPPPEHAAPLRFIALNGDYTADDVPWADLDGGAVPGASWDDAHVPTTQMEWFAEQLQQARASAQRVIVFIHYRLDGGPGGPVGTGLGPSSVPNRAWVDECTLKNAPVAHAQ